MSPGLELARRLDRLERIVADLMEHNSRGLTDSLIADRAALREDVDEAERLALQKGWDDNVKNSEVS